MAFRKPSEFQPGGFFDPDQHLNDVAFLLEPKKALYDQPSKFGSRTEVVADVTVFRTQEALERAEPSAILSGCKITASMLAAYAENIIGDQSAVRIDKIPTRAGKPGAVFRDLPEHLEKMVIAYYNKREAVDGPDF